MKKCEIWARLDWVRKWQSYWSKRNVILSLEWVVKLLWKTPVSSQNTQDSLLTEVNCWRYTRTAKSGRSLLCWEILWCQPPRDSRYFYGTVKKYAVHLWHLVQAIISNHHLKKYEDNTQPLEDYHANLLTCDWYIKSLISNLSHAV